MIASVIEKLRRPVLAAALVAGWVCAYPIAAGAETEPKEHIVEIISDYDNLRMYFKPKLITIAPGDKVTWVNREAEDHNIVSYPDGFPKGASPVESPYLKEKGEKWSYTFKVVGTYDYHCIPHLLMGMHGRVIVSRPSTVEEFHEPTQSEMLAYNKKLRAFFDEEEFAYKTRKQRQKDKKKTQTHQH